MIIKIINCAFLSSTNPDKLARSIIAAEDVTKPQQPQQTIDNETALESEAITASKRSQTKLNALAALKLAIIKLQRKLSEPIKKKFYLHKCLRSHLLPLTNVAFDRSGERCLTGSYDRTCRVINTQSATVEHTLEEHDNVVFAVAFNFPRWQVEIKIKKDIAFLISLLSSCRFEDLR